MLRNISLISVFLLFAFLIAPFSANSQPVFDVNTSINPCDDYATLVLENPWDMSDTADVNHFISNDVVSMSNTSFGSGLFNFTVATTAGSHFYLVTPQINNVEPIGGRWGQNYPIDTSKYKRLTVRMGLDFDDSSLYGLRVVWNRGKLGQTGAERTLTNLATMITKPGTRNYSVDLSSLTSFDSSSTAPQVWTSAAVTGIGLYPSVNTGSGRIDYIRLEDPTTCGSTTVNYNTSVSGNNDYLSFYLDNDSDPTNGYITKLSNSASASSGSSLSLSAAGLMPGSYKVVARFDSDYASLERDNEWDMNESTDLDLANTSGVGSTQFSNGIYSGVTTGSSPNIFLDIPSTNRINAAKYTRLSFKPNLSSNTNADNMLLVWTNDSDAVGFVGLSQLSYDADNDGVYQVNMAGLQNWSGNIKSMYLRLTTVASSGVTFGLDFFQLRSTGFVTNQNQGTNVASAGNLVVSDPPTLQVLQPDIKGGELFKIGDMRQGDIAFANNADSAADPSFPSESLTSFLPDVRSFDGVRGDLYKSTNVAGNDDINDYLNFPLNTSNNYTFNASEYTNLCFKMSLNRPYDIALGSVTKYFYKAPDGAFEAGTAWATIYDAWGSNKWYEYCVDAANHPPETGIRWAGTIDAFRIDPHEFHLDSCCDAGGDPIGNPIQASTYYDYIRLAKRDTSYGKFTLAYQVQDSDTTTPTVSWAYSTSADFSTSTAIPSGDLSCSGQVCIWNTAAVADGEYYIRATATDGVNTNSNRSTGTVKVRNGQGSTEVAPVLSVENPQSGLAVCSNMQIKGYAVNNSIDEPVVAVQVFYDGVFQELVVPSEYSPASRAAYPARLSESGFNFSLPVTNMADGSRVVTVRAYSGNGGIATSDITVSKQTGCVDTVVSDSSPAGVPVAGTVVAPANTATPTPGTGLAAPTITKASLSSSGLMAVSLGGITSAFSGCSVEISAGLTEDSLTSVKSYAVSAANITAGKLLLEASKFKVNKSKIKKFFIGAKNVCSTASSSVTTKSVSPKTTSGSSKIAQVVSGLKKKLKEKSKKKKK